MLGQLVASDDSVVSDPRTFEIRSLFLRADNTDALQVLNGRSVGFIDID